MIQVQCSLFKTESKKCHRWHRALVTGTQASMICNNEPVFSHASINLFFASSITLLYCCCSCAREASISAGHDSYFFIALVSSAKSTDCSNFLISSLHGVNQISRYCNQGPAQISCGCLPGGFIQSVQARLHTQNQMSTIPLAFNQKIAEAQVTCREATSFDKLSPYWLASSSSFTKTAGSYTIAA
eukprot:SAG11_NODE_301_length_11038_cov_2.312826_11_plen_186_part_00